MIKPIAIIAGEPNSISSEIIFKSWKQKNKFKHRPILVIGSSNLLNLQKKKLKYKIKIKNISHNFSISDLKGNQLPVYDVKYIQKKPFEKITSKSNKYILKCFYTGLKLVKEMKILGFVNCPIKKETLVKKKYKGITEFLSEKTKRKGNGINVNLQ
jgi:Pyridoxal phosphate biosynthesis protein